MVLELLAQFFFATLAITVAQTVEAFGMVHFGEMCKFVAHDVVPQMYGQEYEQAGEGNGAVGMACAESALSASYVPSGGF